MTTTGLYARVSTAQQEQRGTIESQLAALDAYAAAQGLTVAPEHRYVDEGYSGARLDRPGLERLRDAAWRGELDRVLILAPDRLARHYAYQYVVLEELERAGCAVTFVNGPGGTSPEERLVREVHGLFAEFERAAFQERGRRGKLHAARAGRFFSGAGAYGYTYVPSDGRGGTCVVNEAEATVVRQVFAWLVEDQLSVAAIARRLTEREVPTRYGRPAWAPATVYKILTNRLYTGEHYYNRTETAPEERGERARPSQRARWYGQPTKDLRRRLRPASEWIPVPWPAIIEAETFAMAERQLRLNRERSPRRTRRPYLLAGLLICGACGRRLGGHAGVASGRYECTRRRSSEPPDQRCRARAVTQRDIEPLVWEEVRALLSRPDVLLAYAREQQEGEGPALTDAQRELRRVERQRAALAREEQRLLDAYQAGALELDELKTRRQRLRQAAQRLDERAQVVQRQVVHARRTASLAETVTGFCARLQAQLVESPFEVRQKVLRLVVERIVVTDDQITIEHIVPGSAPPPTGRLHLRLSRPRQPTRGSGVGAALGGRPPGGSRGAGGGGALRPATAPAAARCSTKGAAAGRRAGPAGVVGYGAADPRPAEGPAAQSGPARRRHPPGPGHHRDEDRLGQRGSHPPRGPPADPARRGRQPLRGLRGPGPGTGRGRLPRPRDRRPSDRRGLPVCAPARDPGVLGGRDPARPGADLADAAVPHPGQARRAVDGVRPGPGARRAPQLALRPHPHRPHPGRPAPGHRPVPDPRQPGPAPDPDRAARTMRLSLGG
jgi:site-specific DNA recombinase